ncbi:hypothetical protein ARAM_007343 [Aspergillus rambellii]|uniref:FCP1 homology domain-containing protein n=1 Tax=Aspergillus rambellii TaxID=308745 RepID=A0A0F8USM7_9EURO|nr:hypothetical protein ARAM_007343 [Aspergillus rambellii]
MLGGSPEGSSSPSNSKSATGEVSMPVVTSNQESSTESPPEGPVATTDPSPPLNDIEWSKQTPPSSASPENAEGSSGAVPTDPPKKLHRLIPIPSRTSLKADKQSTSDKTQDGPQDGSENTRGSRRSLLRNRRDRSRGSSLRSRGQNQEGTAAQESDLRDPAKPEKPMKTSHKLFAFLSCCSSSDVDPEDGSIPPKRTPRRPSVPNTQPTSEKVDVNAGDSSTAESKEPSFFKDEKPNLTVTSDQSASQVDEERTVGGAEPGSQLDGTVTSTGKFDSTTTPPLPKITAETFHVDASQAVQSGAAAPDSEKSDDLGSKAEEVQRKEDTASTTHGPSADSDGKNTSHDEDTAMLPPPPPPIIPLGKQPETTVQERSQQWLLPPALPHLRDRKCLVLDLDETLVHSSFKVLERADFTIPVEIEGQYHNIYVIKRPGVDQFMKRVGELYEVVVFTASVSKYGDPLLDQLDIHGVVHHRLFRDSCYNHQGNYVKDLSQVGRDLRHTIIIDNSPTSYIFHPQHAIPISSWFSDAHDNELLDLIPVLEDLAGSEVRDVSLVLDITL